MKDPLGHGSDNRGGTNPVPPIGYGVHGEHVLSKVGTARGQVYRDAVDRVQGSIQKFAQGLIEGQKKIAALAPLKTAAEMNAEQDKIWGRK
jgi:hypothetical protein